MGVRAGGGSIEVEPEDETKNGSRTVKKIQDPREPSKEERAQHEMTHAFEAVGSRCRTKLFLKKRA